MSTFQFDHDYAENDVCSESDVCSEHDYIWVAYYRILQKLSTFHSQILGMPIEIVWGFTYIRVSIHVSFESDLSNNVELYGALKIESTHSFSRLFSNKLLTVNIFIFQFNVHYVLRTNRD